MHVAMQSLLWRQLVIDFGHELVTAIHMPLMWSNERPNAEEYTAAFHRVSLSSSKVLTALELLPLTNNSSSLKPVLYIVRNLHSII